MRQKLIMILIIFGSIILYCAKILIEASIEAPCDSIHAYIVINKFADVLTWLTIILWWDSCTKD